MGSIFCVYLFLIHNTNVFQYLKRFKFISLGFYQYQCLLNEFFESNNCTYLDVLTGNKILTSFFFLSCSQALATTLSALYGKLLVVMGIAFPMSEVISTHIPHSFYEVTFLIDSVFINTGFLIIFFGFQGYYLYLYFGSMAFLFYMYAMLLKGKPTMTPVNNDFGKCCSYIPEKLF